MGSYGCVIQIPEDELWVQIENDKVTCISYDKPENVVESPCLLHQEVQKQLTEYCVGKRKEFDLPIEYHGTKFQEAIWGELMKIPYGETVSYGELAKSIGKPGAARGVGGAVHRNPIPIIVPCHRVIGADGSLTGFGGGLERKIRYLDIEAGRHEYFPYGDKEVEGLMNCCPELETLIRKTGHIYRVMDTDIYASLVYNIVGQQISMAAVRTIWKRLSKICRISPQELLHLSEKRFRSVGISGRKAEYIKLLSQQVISGALELDSLYEKTDEEVKEILCSIKGIGPWTAEMVMIFTMGRMDIFSADDLGVRKGLARLMQVEQVEEEEIRKFAKKVSPYGTLADFYLWANK